MPRHARLTVYYSFLQYFLRHSFDTAQSFWVHSPQLPSANNTFGTFPFYGTRKNGQEAANCFSSYLSHPINLVTGPRTAERTFVRKPHNPSCFFTKPLVSAAYPLPYYTGNVPGERPNTFRRARGTKFGIVGSKPKRYFAEMDEAQRLILTPALVKLDIFCRLLLSEGENRGQNGDEMLVGESWNHTLFPLAFQLLTVSRSEDNSESALQCVQCATAGIAQERLKDKVRGEEEGDASTFSSFSDLLSPVLGIPCAPRRKHKNGNTRAIRSTEILAEDALELPTTEAIEFIAKQIGRFPYGLLSIARARKGRRSEDIQSEGAQTDYTQRGNNDTKHMIPQILTVSPFWIVDQCQKNSSNALFLPSARQRVIDSVAKLNLIDCELNKGEETSGFNITPFPTTFWLCDAKLTAKISEAELTGWMKEMENGVLLEDKELQKKVIYDNIRFIALRWLLIPRAFLSHFYANNRRCENCRAQKAEGHIFLEYTNGKHSHCKSSETPNAAEGESEILNTAQIQSGTRAVCKECCECLCMLCKLLQCHRTRGIGGLQNFCRIRCLHMQYAHHLACPTALGNMIDDVFGVHSYVD